MNSLTRIAAALLVGAGCPTVTAHEFWIEPAGYTTTTDAALRVALRHGERFRGDVVPRRDDLIDRFVLVGPTGETNVVGRSGATTSYARATDPGLHVIAYHSRHMTNRLDAEAFEAYLREEGLDRIVKIRAERGETNRPGREVYSRCAKSLVLVDDPEPAAPDRVLGLPLEITLERNPASPASAEPVVARVLFRGRPLAGVTLVAVNAGTPDEMIRLVTDENGRVRLTLPAPGPWMLTTIHMVPAPQGVDADWESFWASLTFSR